MPELALAFVISLVVNSIFFAIAALRKTDTVTDLSYGLTFALTAAALLALKGSWDPVRIGAGFFVVVWAIRLAAYLFGRILEMKVDHRFDGIRENPRRFAIFWSLQAASTTIIMLPAIAAIVLPPPRISALHGAGCAVWLAGLLVESIADAQKRAWKRSGRIGFTRSGLWSWSRHPNYFGEMLVWWGIWIFSLPSLDGMWQLAVLGPVYISLLLLFGTGVPPLEKSAEARYGNEPDYQEYKRRTSLIVPLPPIRPS
jgi:steroid 5-alpha reductase family enzyme